ncbi:OLC1v1021685C1 [Oldenlandia corymbosa var. corymbosa]|uniref:OLC1v1021685C1 n=1 Tax=Oldenlandia corymbosa var. corymbosa TaxID=529605 RepID=A0AAV1BXQ5_OLDCO|nr:OLC1v1021685C1 [Oldenlandia corymbosa var. corymbosa]
MKAIVITSPGGPEVLQLKEVEDPEIKDDEVLIKVSAAAVSRADTLQRQGKHPPAKGDSEYPGLECSGTVEAVGKDVTRWKLGDQVCALIGGGGYAEKVAVPEGQVLPVPPGVSLQDAASFPEVTCTVWSTIFMMSHLSSGETLLVHGGSSGIGTFAIQIAKHYGARVFVTAGSLEKLVACRDLGADVGINYKTEDFVARVKEETGGKGVDVILDNVGGPYFQRNLDSLSIGGRLFIIGFMGGTLTEVNLSGILARRLTVQAAGLRSRTKQNKSEIVSEVEKNVWPAIAAGKVKPVVYKYLPLDQAAEAHRLMESSQHIDPTQCFLAENHTLFMAAKFLYSLGFVILFLLSLSFSSYSCFDHQKQSLLHFRSLLRSATNSSLLEDWNSTSQCCHWERIICSSTSPFTVTELHLNSLHTKGNSTVSSYVLTPLFHITSLTLLDISFNFFQGGIPAQGWDNLTSLLYLDMSQNFFNGSIPKQLYHLRYLTYLSLSANNRLSGSLSPEVGYLRSLITLDLDFNNLVGTIPKEIGNLTKLRSLYLDSNGLSGPIPSSFFNLTQLQNLDLHYNQLELQIPSFIGRLRSLSILDLSSNKFIGGIPVSVLNLTQLQDLDLSDNQLSLQIPEDIGHLTNLSTLDLSKNKFTGRIPPSIWNLSKLVNLVLEDNSLSGEIPSWLFDIKTLNVLYLGGNRLTWKHNNSRIAPKFTLLELSLRSCGLTGKVPQWISSQKYLSYLDLSKNELQETFPFWLAEMQLLYMILSDNHLAGALPQQLFKDTLTFLDLSRNNFSGELPENIGDANQIIVLMLSENNFFGTLPSSMSYMQSLELLDISKNKFSGDTFPVFGDGLELVNFSSNEFSGEIPATFSKRTRVLFLGNNRFEGALPRKFINLINLEQLDLRNIKIEGEFPKFLSKISTLQILSLRNTSLQGPLPSNIAKLSNLRILDISNNNLTGSIPQELGNITGMIDVPTNVSILQSYSTAPFVVDETPIHVSELIVDWKRSMLALPSAPGRDDVYCLLDLSKNKLSGEIPTVIDNLKGLKIMNMSYNALSGKIPSSFGGL